MTLTDQLRTDYASVPPERKVVESREDFEVGDLLLGISVDRDGVLTPARSLDEMRGNRVFWLVTGKTRMGAWLVPYGGHAVTSRQNQRHLPWRRWPMTECYVLRLRHPHGVTWFGERIPRTALEAAYKAPVLLLRTRAGDLEMFSSHRAASYPVVAVQAVRLPRDLPVEEPAAAGPPDDDIPF